MHLVKLNLSLIKIQGQDAALCNVSDFSSCSRCNTPFILVVWCSNLIILFQEGIELFEAQNLREVFSIVASVYLMSILESKSRIMKQFYTRLGQYLLELGLGRKNVLSEIEAPDAK